MTRNDIKLAVKEIFIVNSIILTAFDASNAVIYASTDEYFDRILETYNKLKKEEEEKEEERKMALRRQYHD